LAPVRTKGIIPADQPKGEPAIETGDAYVTPGYFDVLGVPVVAGRDFGPEDQPGSPLVAIVSERAGRALWPDGNAVGRSLLQFGDRAFTVIGVVADTQYESLTGEDPGFVFYSALQETVVGKMHVLARATDAPDPIGAITSAISAAGSDVAVMDRRPLNDQVASVLAPQRFGSVLLVWFGALALLIAAVGTYASLAFAVVRRRPELRIRIALGAGASDVLRVLLARALGTVAVGLGVGAGLSMLAARGVERFLFGITPLDGPAFIGALAVLGAGLVLVSLLPARRALRIDAASVMRDR
jgi:ABC-type antimicrobial peptide transport system permease subunit